MKLKCCPVCLLDLHFLNHCGRGVEAATERGSRVEEHSSFQISNQPFSAVFSQHLQPGQFFLGHDQRDLTAATASGPKCYFVCFCLNHPNVLVHGLGQQKAVYTADMRKTWVQISALPLSGCVTLGRLFNFYIFLICKNEDNDTYLEEL